MREIITLDLQKSNSQFAPTVSLRARRGDSRSLSRTFQLLDNGDPVNLADCTVSFMAENAGGFPVIEEVEQKGVDGQFTYRLPDAVTAVRGFITMAYFRVAGSDFVASTNSLRIEVLDNVDLTDSVTGDYVPMLDRIVESADEMMANAEALKSQALRIIDLHNEMAAADDAAEAARVSAEAARATAESARATAEDARAAAESARASAESKRASAEAARASAEGARKSAESERAKAEAARATAEGARENAEQAREVAQARNNADQAANNAAAQGLVAVILASGQYDASTLQPTVTGEIGKMYMVPNPDGEGDDSYVEWMRISGRWERIGLSTASVEAVGTSDIDQVASGTQKVGDQLLNLTGLSYLWAKLKAAFAPYSHRHPNASSSVDGYMSTSDKVKLDGAVTDVTGSAVVIASRSGGSVSLSHANSGVTSGSYGPAANQSPGFGGTVTVGPRLTVNASGHVSSAANMSLTLPNAKASAAADGLMSSADKSKLDGIAANANNYILPVGSNMAIGGVKLSDSTTSTAGQTNGWAATPLAVRNATKATVLYSSGGWRIATSGSVVVVTVLNVKTGNTPWASVTCPYTIPSQYRPAYGMYAPVFCANDWEANGALYVGADGVITLSNYGGPGSAGDNARSGTLAYIIGM